MYDIIVWGATGFVGQLVSEYLAKKINVVGSSGDARLDQLEWAIAGRSLNKLQEIKENIIKINPNASSVGILLGDSSDQSSVDRVIQQGKVIIAVAGPYIRYSVPVVDACIRYGAHYVDITGEAQYVKLIIERYHEAAKAKGLHIVSGCGFDSIPSDLGTFLVADFIKTQLKSDVADVKVYLTGMKGGASGGTLLSGVESVEQLGVKFLAFQTDALMPKGSVRSNDSKDVMGFGYDSNLNLWTAPFLMSIINSKVVRRSYGLSNGYYGSNFHYAEGSGRRFVTAMIYTIVTYVIIAAMMIPPLRWAAKKYGLQPGQGPSKEERENGFFKFRVVGVSEAKGGVKPAVVKATLQGKGDGGYKLTSVMVAEAALCLLLDLDLGKDKSSRTRKSRSGMQVGFPMEFEGGVLTPSTSMGYYLVDRLNQNGMSFTLDSK